MVKFEKMRNDALGELKKAESSTFSLEKKSESLKEKSDQIKEGISRIPHDLPEDLQQLVDAACEKAQSDVKSEAKALEDEAYDAVCDADQATDKINHDGSDLMKKGAKLEELRKIPLLGAFVETKSLELKMDGELLLDVASETREYSDRLAATRNKLMGI